MFGISFETWKNICEMYFSIETGSLKSYLQWFPFSKLSDEQKKQISSRDFYNHYIEPAAFVFYKEAMNLSENFLQKTGGSFRDATLVSPLLYLVLQAVGKEISNCYEPQRSSNISVYYSGNYDHMRPKYKQEYDDFFKELNGNIDEYQYFIKMDIANFFPCISVNLLVSQIDSICNRSEIAFSQTQLQLFKNLLIYCGNGKFPLIENSMASSYLATVIYLDSIDVRLYKYLSDKVHRISDFHMVRYVDDLYILISAEEPIENLNSEYNEIRNEYSSILKEVGLQLNTEKCCIKRTKEINQELKKSLYDEYFYGEKQKIEDMFAGNMKAFIEDLSHELLLDNIDTKKYNDLIDKNFSADDIEFVPNEVFNYFVYENEHELQQKAVVAEIENLVEQSASFISLDPKRLTVMIMKAHSDRAIKGMLNQLFKRHRSGKWNSYDTMIAISYLLQSEFRHIDLLDIISKQNLGLYKYYIINCKDSFICHMCDDETEKLIALIGNDGKACYLYFMYLCEMLQKNYMAAYSYFKNFFDRITADLDFAINKQPEMKKPNYKKFHTESNNIKFYEKIENSECIIRIAHNLRNSNPLEHASAELLDKSNPTSELMQSINDLWSLIFAYINLIPDLTI